MKYRVFQIMLEGFSLVNSEFGKDRLPSLQEESFVCAVNFVTFLCPAACARLFWHLWARREVTDCPSKWWVWSLAGFQCLCLVGCVSE